MKFKMVLKTIPCQVHVTRFEKALPMRVTGSGFGDADPPEDEVFEYQLLDHKGNHLPWLEHCLCPEDIEQIREEFQIMHDAEMADPYSE